MAVKAVQQIQLGTVMGTEEQALKTMRLLYDQEDAAYREDSHEDGGDACGKRRKTGLEEADGTVRAFGGQCP